MYIRELHLLIVQNTAATFVFNIIKKKQLFFNLFVFALVFVVSATQLVI